MINYKLLDIAATFEEDSLKWTVPDEIENAVYFIHFSNSETYVGSTKKLHRRFSVYITAFKNGNYCVKKMQEAFNDSDSFTVYILERDIIPDKLRLREQFYIDALEPSLNSSKASTGIKKKCVKDLRIKESIRLKGMTISEVAERMGINRVSLSSIINGNPTVETLEKISNVLGVPVRDFFPLQEEEPSPKGNETPVFVCPKYHTVYEIKPKG